MEDTDKLEQFLESKNELTYEKLLELFGHKKIEKKYYFFSKFESVLNKYNVSLELKYNEYNQLVFKRRIGFEYYNLCNLEELEKNIINKRIATNKITNMKKYILKNYNFEHNAIEIMEGFYGKIFYMTINNKNSDIDYKKIKFNELELFIENIKNNIGKYIITFD